MLTKKAIHLIGLRETLLFAPREVVCEDPSEGTTTIETPAPATPTFPTRQDDTPFDDRPLEKDPYEDLGGSGSLPSADQLERLSLSEAETDAVSLAETGKWSRKELQGYITKMSERVATDEMPGIKRAAA